jgi:ATP-dependent Clp protease, protease subunit
MLNFGAQCLADGQTVELSMYDVIGKSLFFEGITADAVSKALANAPNASLIRVRINSPGGSGFEGNAIRNILEQHPARVEVHIDGVAASAASIIAMAADEGGISIARNAQMMVHEATTNTSGGLREHRAQTAMLENTNNAMAADYARRTGKTDAEIRHLMSETTWLTAEKAVEMKFADKVVERQALPGKWDRSVVAALYGELPAAIASLMPAQDPPAQPASPTGQQVTAGADRPPPNEENEMATNFARIAAALGLPEAADENTVLASVSAMRDERLRREHFLTEVETLAGQRGPDALAAVRAITTFAADVEALAGKRGAEAMGALRAWRTASEQLPTMQARIETMEKERDEQERAQLVAQGTADKKLTPAITALFKDKPVAELRGFLAVAPKVVPEEVRQGSTGAPLASAQKWEELKPMEKATLHRNNPEVYAALKSDFEQRTGKRIGADLSV